jgi:transcriptional regulator with XRE-family HTH domain
MQVIISREVPGIGKAIKERRLELNKSIYDLAPAVGMSVPHWYRIEKSVAKSAHLETVTKMAQILGMNVGVRCVGLEHQIEIYLD